MELKRGNIVLKRLTVTDIEMVRQWRNSEDVSAFMEFRGQITQKDQEAWFDSINNRRHLYFLVYATNIPIGLIYGAEIDWTTKTVGNAGIFIALPAYREAAFALSASLLLNDFAFAFGIECICIKVLHTNPVAQRYNIRMGYRLLPNQESVYNQLYSLRREDYCAKAGFLRRISHSAINFAITLNNQVLDVQNLTLTPLQKQALALALEIPCI